MILPYNRLLARSATIVVTLSDAGYRMTFMLLVEIQDRSAYCNPIPHPGRQRACLRSSRSSKEHERLNVHSVTLLLNIISLAFEHMH